MDTVLQTAYRSSEEASLRRRIAIESKVGF